MTDLRPIPPREWPASLDAVRAQMGTPLNVHCMLANHPDREAILSYREPPHPSYKSIIERLRKRQ